MTSQKKKNNATEVASYEVIEEKMGVVIKVPKKSGFMTYKPAFGLANGDNVSEHWHNGKPLGKGIFLNLYFYGVSDKNLGKKIIATVKVIVKKMSDGQEFIMMNIHHTPDASCQYNFSMPKYGNLDMINDIVIDEHVPEVLAFRLRKHDKLKL